MRIVKVLLIILVILASAFVGYQGYLAYEKWQQTEKSRDQLLIESLKANEGAIITLSTKLSDIEMKVVNDTLKTVVEIIPDKSYESLKEQVIELSEDKETNKDKIEELREQLSEQRKNFLASDDTILIKDIDGNSLLLYRDSDGALQPASAQISKIIEHKDIDLAVGDICSPPVIEKKKMNIKAGLYYDIIEKNYGGIISKQLIGIKDYSLNISLLSDMLSLEGLKIGADLGYNVSDFELGIGINHKKDIYVKFQYTF